MRAPEFWSRRDGAARAAATALAPIGWIYGAVTDWKRANTKAYRPRARVVCVGNLTAGGSGKTPIVLAIAEILKARGVRVFVLSRGYGGQLKNATRIDPYFHRADDVGDEPLFLAAHAPVIISRDRQRGAQLADAQGAEVIVMDDGHQNFTLQKDLSIVVVDAEDGFGNGHILPAGPLRETVQGGLARADAVMLVGKGAPLLPGYSGPVIRARLAPKAVQTFEGRSVIAFAGIGRPEKFFGTLRALQADVVDSIVFADHHKFRPDEIARLKTRAQSEGAMLVTTEKDFVRLTATEREGIAVLPIAAEFDPSKLLEELLTAALSPAAGERA